jgi:hypothetical protein
LSLRQARHDEPRCHVHRIEILRASRSVEGAAACSSCYSEEFVHGKVLSIKGILMMDRSGAIGWSINGLHLRRGA